MAAPQLKYVQIFCGELKMFEEGDIFFVMSDKNSTISKVMSYIMRSKFSHCGYIMGKDESGRTLTIETNDYCVIIGMIKDYLDPNQSYLEVYRKINATEDECIESTENALTLRNRLYGYLQLLSFLVQILVGRVGIKMPNFIRQGQVCTAIPLTAWNKHFKIDPESIHTQTFYEIVSNSKEWKRIK